MSKFTDFLNLFKWDPVEDAEEEFNIEKSLNENWDKIDTKLKTYITTLQANKVDKEDGKNLSTNDYTNKEKEKLNNIESNAQVNLIEKIQKNGIDIDIINKIVNLILTKNDVGLDNVDNTSDIDKPLSNAVITELTKKLDKTSKATSTEAIAGTNNTKYTTPYTVKSAIDKALEGYTPSGGGGGGDTLPIGAILPFSSDAIPNGWLLCDGRAVSRTEYAELFKAIGTKHGLGNGSTTFNLPNPKGRTLVGKDSTDTDFNELGKTGGEKTHTLTVDEMPSHKHELIVNKQQGGVNAALQPTWGTAFSSTDSSSVLATGGDQPHNNLQPYLVTNYIIKAKMTVAIEGEIIQENGTASTTNVYSAKAIDNKLKKSIVTGQEIATNEYIDGKRVYKRNISAIGENSSGTTLTLSNINFDFSEIWIDESNSFISSESETLSINWYFAPEDYCRLWIGKNTKIIRYRTGGNLSGRTFNVMLKYTKNT